MPVYLLVVAKNGAKLKEAKDDEQTRLTRGAGPGLQVTLQKWPVTGLANTLSGVVGRPVLDKTGLAGKYDFKLEWAEDSPPHAGDAGPSPSDGADVDSGPSIFTAVQEQLGLKLEAGKGPVEVMIIDHVDRASEN